MTEAIQFREAKLFPLALGTVQLGMNYGVMNQAGAPSQAEANAIIAACRKLGLNCFDTAQAYGQSEAVLGRALVAGGFPGAQVISKISAELLAEGTAALRESLRKSLASLGKPSILGLLLHEPSLLLSWREEYSATVRSLREEGAFSHFGVSIYDPDEFTAALQNPLVDLIQLPFNPLDPRARRENWFARAHDAGKLVFIRSVFLQGLLLAKPETLPAAHRSLELLSNLRAFADAGARHGLDQRSLLFAYVKSWAPHAITIVGCENVAQLEENFAAFAGARALPEAALTELQKKLVPAPPKVWDPRLWA